MNTAPTWVKPARLLADFVSTNNRLPVQSGSTDPVEKRAGNILRRFRRSAAAKELEPEVRTWLDENVTGWMSDNTRPTARGMRGRRTFAAEVAATVVFARRHGRLPSATGNARRERELGVFLRNHRQAARGKGTTSWTPSKHSKLDRMLPGWNGMSSAWKTSASGPMLAAVAL